MGQSAALLHSTIRLDRLFEMTPPWSVFAEGTGLRRSGARTLRVAVGVFVGGVAFVLACRGVEWGRLFKTLQTLNYYWIGLSLLCVFLNLVTLTFRWRLLFFPDQDQRGWFGLLQSLVTSQAVNVVMPGRVGELARAYSVGQRGDISKIHVLGTIVVEKIMDGAMLSLGIVVLWSAMVLPSWAVHAGNAVVVISVVATAAALLFAFYSESCLRWLERLTKLLPNRVGQRILDYGKLGLNGFRAMRSWWVHCSIWALSLGVLSLSVCTNYFLFRAFDLSLAPVAALFLLIVLQIGNAPPSLPGKIGVFHFLTVLALAVFAVDRSVALAYSAVLYCVSVVSKIVLAGLFWVLPPLFQSSYPQKRSTEK